MLRNFTAERTENVRVHPVPDDRNTGKNAVFPAVQLREHPYRVRTVAGFTIQFVEINHRIRAYHDFPSVFPTLCDGKRFKQGKLPYEGRAASALLPRFRPRPTARP